MQSKLFRRSKCAIYSFEITDEQISEMKQFIQSIEAEREQYSYNFIGLFGFINNKPINRKTNIFVHSLWQQY
ncbi:hypothetical protein ACOQFO_16535 [Ureibacillus sp. MALMAid1270]|uniref:hypothetical protein n=1 Tax=Ureibacillus sp. MALMAid1270 TaxID=3411629 RepID=UPI003BA3E902